jgi:hypothetical protein
MSFLVRRRHHGSRTNRTRRLARRATLGRAADPKHRQLRLEGLESRALLSVSPPELISYWTFDEGAGNVAGDWSNGNHGTIHGATWTDGIVGGALSFDGVDDFVDAGSTFSTPESFTIEAWVNIADYSTNPIVGNRDVDLSHQTYNMASFVMREYYGPAGKPLFVVGQAAWDWEHFLGDTALDLNEWYHVAFVFDYSQTTKAEIYVNGVLDGAYTTTEFFGDAIGPINCTPGISLEIGRDYVPGYEGPYHFSGLIDEVAIYDGP